MSKDFDPEDPFALIGVEMPAASEAETRDMALCFAEEFIRDGFSEERLLAIFRNPFYQGPYRVWRERGDPFVIDVIRQAASRWRPVRKETGL